MEVHALAPAPGGGLYVGHLARWQDLPGRRRRHRENRSSIPTTSTSGRSPSRPTGRCLRRDRRKGQHLSHHARRPGHRSSTRRHHQRRRAGDRQERAICWPEPNRPAASSASTATPRRSCCSIPRSRKSTRCGWPPTAPSTPPPSAARPAAKIAARRAGHRRSGRSCRARARAERFRRNHRHHRRRRRLGRACRGRIHARARDRPYAKGAIYRIRPDGLWDTVWEAVDDWPFDC